MKAPPSSQQSPPPPPDDSPANVFLRELVDKAFETLRVGLCIIESDSNRILLVNDAFSDITGFTKVDLVHNALDCVLTNWPLWSAVLLPHLEEIKQRGREAGSAHWDVDLPSGRRTLEVYGQPIASPDGKLTLVLMAVEDITERQTLSSQLVQSEKLAAIGTLAAGIAHEIRSPLATIYNALYDLQSIIGDSNADATENVTIAIEEIRRVQGIINNLLDFARDSERHVDFTCVNDGLQRILRLLQKDLSDRNIEVVTELENLPPGLISPNAVKQVLINLFTNAMQAMSGGGTLTVRTEVREGPVGARQINRRPGVHMPETTALSPQRGMHRASDLQHIVITVSDTGHGIPPEIVPNIFHPFFTTKPPGSGTGLGLSVVHSQIRECGGLIGVDSRLGKGTTFTIFIPALDARDSRSGDE